MEKTFGDVEVNKIEFHATKKPVALNLVDTDIIVVSDKFKHNDKGYKYFIGYQEDDIVRSLYIILPQMSESI